MGQPPRAVSTAPDHWAVLGLAPGSDAASLKRAFRAQARRWHPDLNGNDPVAEERFKQVNEAYAVLSDPQRRQAWEAGEDGAAASPTDPFATGFPDFHDYLEHLWGRGRSRRRSADPLDPDPEAGRDPQGRDPSDWDSFARDAPDDQDPAAGEPPPEAPMATAAPTPAPVPYGSDQESQVDLTPEQALRGTAVQLELPDGTVVEVPTPPLAGDGWRLRLEGVAPGGRDHFLQLRVRTPEGLRLDGLRVHYDLELSPADAALGCRVVVPTLEGPVQLQVPPGSSSGRLLRLKGRGLELGRSRGDQIVALRIVLPPSLSEAEQALYRRLRELAAESVAGGAAAADL
ncbi:MAG: DnaJ C-terminal domain-containing protein [Synechococcus sp.]